MFFVKLFVECNHILVNEQVDIVVQDESSNHWPPYIVFTGLLGFNHFKLDPCFIHSDRVSIFAKPKMVFVVDDISCEPLIQMGRICKLKTMTPFIPNNRHSRHIILDTFTACLIVGCNREYIHLVIPTLRHFYTKEQTYIEIFVINKKNFIVN